jgi:DNA-binding PucR family transcriptional regulator
VDTTAKIGLSGSSSEVELRSQLSSLQGLLVLSMLMTENGDELAILNLAATSVPSLGDCKLVGGYLADHGWHATGEALASPDLQRDIEAQLAVLDVIGGPLAITGKRWAWAFPLRSLGGHFGYLAVVADAEPAASELFLLRVLAQQAGIALANAKLHQRERAQSEQLLGTNAALERTVAALEQRSAIHARLTRVAVALEGQDGIARAVHELTGFPVALEDRHGNLRAWAGPDRPDPYPKDDPAVRERLVSKALAAGKPIRDGGRLLTVALPREDVLGVIVLIDPDSLAGEHEEVAIELATTVLSMELARLQSLGETEIRLGRDLVEELLSGTDAAGAAARALALGYDLERRHRVVVVECDSRHPTGDSFFHAVRRAARDTGVGTLLVARGSAVVVLSDADRPWEDFRHAVESEIRRGSCRVGVGGPCDQPDDFPRSFQEAQLALRLQRSIGATPSASVFDELGVWRLLADVQDAARVERFVRQWLAALLDYDERRSSDLTNTLSVYLARGGGYDAAAAELSIHRSTLKYRLQRIRELSGHDLGDPDTLFNLQLATRAWQTLQVLRQPSPA